MSNEQPKTLADSWPESTDFKKSIRLEFSLYVSGIIILLMMVTGLVVRHQFERTVTRNVAEKLLVQARSYSRPAGKLIISADGPDALLLNNICMKLAEDNPDVYWAGITSADNAFIAHTDLKQVIAGASMTAPSPTGFVDLLQVGETFELRRDSVFTVVPITENGISLGHLAVASSARQIKDARMTSIVMVALITVAMILLGLPITLVLVNRKLRPIRTITDSLQQVRFDDIKLDIPLAGKNEFCYLAETLRVMGGKLNTAQKQLVEHERMARELEIARDIQASILPRDFPKGDGFEFAGAYQSAREVGGDYYDFIEFADGQLAYLVADVSGKSLPGMLVMLLTRDIVRRHAHNVRQPAKLLSYVNRDLLVDIKRGMFVTMFLGVLDPMRSRFTYASAGHNPLIWLKADDASTELLKTKGYPLGLMPVDQFDKRIESGTIDLNPGDVLIQYTDGINEAQSESKEEYGMSRFIEALESTRSAAPDTLVERLLQGHAEFVGGAPQYDDITLLAMKWTNVPVDINSTKHGDAIIAG